MTAHSTDAGTGHGTTRWTNVHNVPDALANAVIRDTKSSAGDYSVTQLLAPPRIRWLLQRNEVSTDVSERIWALLGKGVHAVLARNADDPELQLVSDEGPVRVSGTLDSVEFHSEPNIPGGTIRDWKLTSVFTDSEGRKEWEEQLNLYRWLYATARRRINYRSKAIEPHTPRVADRLQVTMIFRDWSAARAERAAETIAKGGADDYPRSITRMIDVPVWDIGEAYRFLRERLTIHQQAEQSEVIPNVCSDAERWHRPGTHAVRKEGRKTALRVLSSHADALAWAEHNGSPGLSIEHRPGRDVRCESWCAARSVCPHAIALPKPKPSTTDESNGGTA